VFASYGTTHKLHQQKSVFIIKVKEFEKYLYIIHIKFVDILYKWLFCKENRNK